MDIVVKGRRAEVSDRYRSHVREKLARLGRLDGKAFRVDVEVCHESNPRLSGSCERIELTVYSRGPVIRAEAAAGDVYAALDLATAKLEERLRRAAERRRDRHHGHGNHHGTAHGTAATGAGEAPPVPSIAANGQAAATTDGEAGIHSGSSNGAAAAAALGSVPAPASGDDAPEPDDLGDVLVADGPLVVRQKTHEAEPISLDEALHHMELVGHDFFLFCDAACGLPSVVYRRRGYTYGVLRLQTRDGVPGAAGAPLPPVGG